MLSGICCSVNEMFILWNFMQHRMVVLYRCFRSWSHHQRSSTSKMGPVDCPKTSVQNYHSVLRKILKQHRSQNTCCIIFITWHTQVFEPVPRNSDTSFNSSHLFSAAHTLELHHPATLWLYILQLACVKHIHKMRTIFHWKGIIDFHAHKCWSVPTDLFEFLRHSFISSYLTTKLHV